MVETVVTICNKCDEILYGDAVIANGRCYHVRCFSCVVAGCDNDILTVGYFVIEEGIYCRNHYHTLNDSKCAVCEGYIEGDAITANDFLFHAQCFLCFNCKAPFPQYSEIFYLEEKLLCSDCNQATDIAENRASSKDVERNAGPEISDVTNIPLSTDAEEILIPSIIEESYAIPPPTGTVEVDHDLAPNVVEEFSAIPLPIEVVERDDNPSPTVFEETPEVFPPTEALETDENPLPSVADEPAEILIENEIEEAAEIPLSGEIPEAAKVDTVSTDLIEETIPTTIPTNRIIGELAEILPLTKISEEAGIYASPEIKEITEPPETSEIPPTSSHFEELLESPSNRIFEEEAEVPESAVIEKSAEIPPSVEEPGILDPVEIEESSDVPAPKPIARVPPQTPYFIKSLPQINDNTDLDDRDREQTGYAISIDYKINIDILDRCKVCHKVIRPDHGLTALDKHYHLWCFTCIKCGILLTSEYMSKDGQPYCENDYQHYHGVLCAGCGSYITGKVLQAGDLHFHPNCCRCTKCGESFGEDEDMYLQDDAMWHPNCTEKTRFLEALTADKPSKENFTQAESPNAEKCGSIHSLASSEVFEIGADQIVDPLIDDNYEDVSLVRNLTPQPCSEASEYHSVQPPAQSISTDKRLSSDSSSDLDSETPPPPPLRSSSYEWRSRIIDLRLMTLSEGQ